MAFTVTTATTNSLVRPAVITKFGFAAKQRVLLNGESGPSGPNAQRPAQEEHKQGESYLSFHMVNVNNLLHTEIESVSKREEKKRIVLMGVRMVKNDSEK